MKPITLSPGEPPMTKQLEAMRYYLEEARSNGLEGKDAQEYAEVKYREWMWKHERKGITQERST